MKKVYYILGMALLIISGCMIYLVIKGVSLRSEPIIKPSPVDVQYQNITYGVFHRLFPIFQQTDFVIWGINKDLGSEEGTIFELLLNEHAVQLGERPKILEISDKTSADEIKNCTKPCWIVVDREKASRLSEHEILKSLTTQLGQKYFSITFLEFDRNLIVPVNCEKEQRLDFLCLLPVSVREVRRYFKNIATRYFFMRSYNEIDYFLFLEKVM